MGCVTTSLIMFFGDSNQLLTALVVFEISTSTKVMQYAPVCRQQRVDVVDNEQQQNK